MNINEIGEQFRAVNKRLDAYCKFTGENAMDIQMYFYKQIDPANIRHLEDYIPDYVKEMGKFLKENDY